MLQYFLKGLFFSEDSIVLLMRGLLLILPPLSLNHFFLGGEKVLLLSCLKVSRIYLSGEVKAIFAKMSLVTSTSSMRFLIDL